jgi:hypothetical protein
LSAPAFFITTLNGYSISRELDQHQLQDVPTIEGHLTLKANPFGEQGLHRSTYTLVVIAVNRIANLICLSSLFEDLPSLGFCHSITLF